jgi:hypothetical protein
VKQIMSTLRQWGLDWLDRSNIKPSERKLDDPLTLLKRVFAALAGIIAVLSNPAVSVLVPNLNGNAALVLRGAVTLATLVAVNYVVTAKDIVETVSGIKSETVRSYRYSSTERWISRGVIGIAGVLLILNLVPPPAPPRNCDITATVSLRSQQGTEKPLFLSLILGGREERYPAEEGKLIAMQVPSAYISSFSIALVWSDNSRSDFGKFSGCSAPVRKGSTDDRAKIDLEGP